MRRVLLGYLLVFGGTGVARADLPLHPCRVAGEAPHPTVKARCGSLRRPLDPERPDGPALDIAIAVVPSLSAAPEPDPFVIIAGGPGQSAFDAYLMLRGAFESVRRDRDILLVDQRGTGRSQPLVCPRASEGLESDPHPQRVRQAMQACLEELPADPRLFTTSIAVQDLEAVRAALERPRLNLYGVSYGTRVAQHFLRRFPDRVRTVILDGVVPSAVALGPQLPGFAQDALDAHFERCARHTDCHDRFGDLHAATARILDRVDAEPARVSMRHPFTGEAVEKTLSRSDLANALRLLSYSAATTALLPFVITEADRGRYEPLAAQALLAEINLGSALSIGMHAAVVCAEDVPFTRSSTGRPSYLGTMMSERTTAMCETWPRGPVDDDLHAVLESDVPALLLSGELDPVTPPRWGALAKAGLPNSLHLVGKGQGHVLAGSGCVPWLIGRFVRDASTRALDTRCLGRLRPEPFFVDMNGPRP